MAPPLDPAGPAGPHLVVLLRGVGGRHLAEGPLAALRPAAGQTLPLLPPGLDAADDLLAALPTDELRRLGLGIDRSSLMLQPRWRSDEQAVQRIAARPLGPAHVTMLELARPLRAAAAAGCGTRAAEAAFAALARDVQTALDLVARRGRPNLWLAALGEPVPTAHVLDVAALARRIVGWPYAHTLHVRQTSAAAWITADGQHALDLLSERLPDSALGGAIVRTDARGLVLLAPPCTGFGRGRRFARTAHAHEAQAGAVVPWALRTTDRIDLAGLAARVAMAAAGLAVDRRRRHLPSAAPATHAPQLLPIADHRSPAVADPWQFEFAEFDAPVRDAGPI